MEKIVNCYEMKIVTDKGEVKTIKIDAPTMIDAINKFIEYAKVEPDSVKCKEVGIIVTDETSK